LALLGFINLFDFFALTNFLATASTPLILSFAPKVPKLAICPKASDNLPTALCSANSSKGFSLSKNFSTSTA
jgi:hypothetical protein